jgi:acyl phosphate:glycerol-3-phosphate acyltransferase
MIALDVERVFPILLCAVAFLLGSVPFGLIVGRIFKIADIRREGSGNIGATNVTRVLGLWPAGVMTFGLDMAKGALPVFILSSPLFSELWPGIFEAVGMPANAPFGISAEWAVAFAAVFGHCYSPWLHFHGGKGVSTGFGALLVLAPVVAIVGFIAFAVAFAKRRISSLASITGVFAASVAHLVLHPLGVHLWFGAGVVFLILLRHEGNIDALLSDNEPAIG